jgi:peptidoglycan-associated lipoprotein
MNRNGNSSRPASRASRFASPASRVAGGAKAAGLSRLAALAPLAVALVLSVGTGCAKKTQAAMPQAPVGASAAQSGDPASTTMTTAAMGSDLAPVPVSPNLSVSSAIARACHLTAQRATPEFDFDSTQIVEEDRTLLGTLAKCMAEGELRGKSVALTGRTDPRGESEYNMSLGESRADSVQRYLHDLGVASARLHATSRGEMDAVGTDESSFAHDRRVDIDLAN